MFRTWGPVAGATRALLIAVPGWNATAGDIEPLARYLALRGIRVYSSGIRGQHGDLTAKSQHTQGDITDGRIWTRDFCEFTRWVRRRYPRTPVFFYGQSMGALIVLTAADATPPADRAQLRGIILHSPAVAMMYAVPPVRSFTALMRTLYGHRLLFNIGLISGEKPTLTSDATFDRIWGQSSDRVDPGFTWRFFDEALKLGARARAAAARLQLPVLLLTGDKDPIGTAGVGQRAFTVLIKTIPSSSKQRIRFPDGYHDLIHDKNKPRALQSIAAWIDRQL
jgi:alpha-beta hydrolase superfamily lysophospholipase